jgi:hypothetical protein
VGPGSAPTTGTWLENDAMKLRRGTKEFYKPCFSGWAVGFNVENNETIAYIPTALKAVNVNFIADVAVKTKGKLNAVAQLAEYLLMFLQSLLQSPLLPELETELECQLGLLDGLLDSSIKTNMLKTPFF